MEDLRAGTEDMAVSVEIDGILVMFVFVPVRESTVQHDLPDLVGRIYIYIYFVFSLTKLMCGKTRS
jgi:hypothetical protein